MGPSRMFGKVAARKTRPVASGEFGDAVHENAERNLMQPVAEEADRLRQPVGRETRVESEPDVRMTADLRADENGLDRPEPMPVPSTTGRSRPIPVVAAALAPGTQRDPRRLSGVRATNERREDEPRQARGDEGVADACDVGQERQRDRDDVANRPGVQEELER